MKQKTAQRPRSRDQRLAYWRANLILIAGLIVLWAMLSFVFSVILVEPLNRFSIGERPLGGWFAQQGSLYVFIILIFVYVWAMDRLDRKFQVRR